MLRPQFRRSHQRPCRLRCRQRLRPFLPRRRLRRRHRPRPRFQSSASRLRRPATDLWRRPRSRERRVRQRRNCRPEISAVLKDSPRRRSRTATAGCLGPTERCRRPLRAPGRTPSPVSGKSRPPVRRHPSPSRSAAPVAQPRPEIRRASTGRRVAEASATGVHVPSARTLAPRWPVSRPARRRVERAGRRLPSPLIWPVGLAPGERR